MSQGSQRKCEEESSKKLALFKLSMRNMCFGDFIKFLQRNFSLLTGYAKNQNVSKLPGPPAYQTHHFSPLC
jgi:hypothetical protein